MSVVTAPPNQKISVAYHLFAVNNWKKIFSSHISEILASGLYSACQDIYVGLNYIEPHQIDDLLESVRDYPKIKLTFARKVPCGSNGYLLPVTDSGRKAPLSTIEVGEAETILYMAELSKDMNCDTIIFLHSKGVTCPGIRSGQSKQFKVLANWLGLPAPATHLEADAMVHEAIIRYIHKWKAVIDITSVYDCHYLIWNVFAIQAAFLKTFNWSKWFNEQTLARYSSHKFSELTDRHVFAGFPLKLYSQSRSLRIAPIADYFNYPYPLDSVIGLPEYAQKYGDLYDRRSDGSIS